MDDLLTACRIVDAERLTDAFGHVSARVDGDQLLINSKAGPGLTVAASQLLRTTIDGEFVDGDFSMLPAEVAIHQGIYRARPDVNAVCRFHGTACMAWATLGRALPTTTGIGLALGASVPVHDRTRTVTTAEEADEVAATLADGAAVLLRGFGAVTVGRTIPEAIIRAHALERSAAAVLSASAIGEPLTYPPEVFEELKAADVVMVGQFQRAWNYFKVKHGAAPTASAATELPAPKPAGELEDMSEGSIWLELLGGGVSQRYYDAGGVRTRVLEAGDGPTLLLLHGTGGHAETYYRNIVPLSEHYRVLAVDMIGHGFTDRPDEVTYSLDDFADHIAKLLDAIGVERAAVSGESLGSAVAAWFAIKYPDRIERLVMNTAVLKQPNEKGLGELEEFARRTMEVMSGGFTRDAVRTRMEWLVAEPGRMTEELVTCRYRIYGQPGMLQTVGKVMMSIGSMFRGVANQQYFEAGVMSRIQCPTLVLWTEHNPGQDAEFAEEAVADIPDHKFKLLTDCGHWPQFEQPEEFNRLHLEFLGALV